MILRGMRDRMKPSFKYGLWVLYLIVSVTTYALAIMIIYGNQELIKDLNVSVYLRLILATLLLSVFALEGRRSN